ncbi:MAG: cation diffusion facilitator family transporter [Proteobacteria bacterium]|nr:MAG: cation diffusion facilitator family transporter [Pseudomonadota bacterium]
MRHDHTHANLAAPDAGNERRIFRAMLLTGGFTVAELIGGVLSGSLALIADAGHMFGDFVALALAWAAFRVAKKSPDLRRSFGYHRFQVLAAFVNGISLLAIAIWILVAAGSRLLTPHDVLAGPMLVIATLGLVINVIVFFMLTGGGHTNLNLRGAALHVMGDLLGSIAAIGAAVIILLTGWMQADPLLSVLAAMLIIRAGYTIVKQSGHILLEGTPEEVDPAQVSKQLIARIPEVLDIHHVHIWSLTDERPVLTLHARVAENVEHDRIMIEIHRALESLFGVSHATVQLEYGPCSDELGEH